MCSTKEFDRRSLAALNGTRLAADLFDVVNAAAVE